MLIRPSPPLHLTYCLNVHPGETGEACFAAIREKATAVRDRVAPGRRFGLGLRLGAHAARQLARRHAFSALRDFLDAQNLYVFTINGFPHGSFHGRPVKEDVYRPDWQDPERLAYTRLLADLLAALLPAGVAGSISTVPLSFKAWIRGPAQVDAMIAHLVEVVAHLDDIQAATGKDLHVGLEPEPACVLETTEETVRFFRDRVWTLGTTLLVDKRGVSRADAEASLRRRLGVCLDTCHVALQFEDPAEAWDRYLAEGIRLSKVQLSAALACGAGAKPLAALAPFEEPTYLHQAHARGGRGTLRRWTDLPEARRDLAARGEADEVRVHFHVPLHWAGSNGLGTTRDTLTDAFFARLGTGGTEHLEIETYTFDVLPPELRGGDVVASIAREYQWALARLPRERAL